MTENATLVSIVVPVYNGERFVGEAIESVLAQNYRSLEVLVVDDGSTDGTAAVVSAYGAPVCYHRQENAGAAAARNTGVKLARGAVIGFLDADDLYAPKKLGLQLPRLEKSSAGEIVLGFRQYYMLANGEGGNDRFREHMEPMMALQLGCGLFRAEVFDKVGPFNTQMRISDDWDWFMRARELGVGLLIHRHVVLYQRIHQRNITRQRELGQRETLWLLRESLGRRRDRSARASLPPLASFLEDDGHEKGDNDH